MQTSHWFKRISQRLFYPVFIRTLPIDMAYPAAASAGYSYDRQQIQNA